MGLSGEQIIHKLCTLSNVDDSLSEIVNIKLTLDFNFYYVTCTAYVIDNIPIKYPAVHVSESPHLQDLPLTGNYMYGYVKVMLGQVFTDTLVPLVITQGLTGPFATQTTLGGSLNELTAM